MKRSFPKERWATAYFFQNGDVTWMTTETGKLVTGRLSPSGFERISEAQLIESNDGHERKPPGRLVTSSLRRT